MPKKSKPVGVPPDVLEGLEQIRESGEVNMLDRDRVQILALSMGLPAVVVWIEEHQSEYAQGVIFCGFAAEHD